MSYKVDQVKTLWNLLSDAEKKEFTVYLFDSGKKSLREGFESFSVNKSTTMQFGDANVCPACGK
ncbi:TPA: hypothetical protein RM800_001382 [Yersinia enterocolitica]|nr:hypothetical protein [Yersinia enterocolitica]EKN5913250.1 hypothetical protein [Yersinia enterocolitica]HDL7735609.1 hypothetical protein [Yersinia enterocolitica]HDW8041372.1 hypothetical protein [Yersinia enterocolitica]HEM6610324.1 hypothetical protein [Yersinia enterocolitica]